MNTCTIVCALLFGLAQGGAPAMTNTFLKSVTAGDAAAVRSALAADPSLRRARDERGVSALLLALYYRQTEVAAVLAEGRDDLDVFEAAATGRVDRVRELVARDPSLANAFSPDGFPPLGLAVFFGQRETAEALVAAGADTKAAARNPMRVAPIHAAAAAGRADIARLLLDHGADPNARQEGEFAPLHEAARAGNLELVRLLVERGADVNAATKDGGTPLTYAGDHADVAAFLRAHGAK
jgi:ankyrin repeat protein